MSSRHSIVTLLLIILVAPAASVILASEPATAMSIEAEAAEFVREAEDVLLYHWIRKERATWVQENFITDDTEVIAAEAYRDLMAATAAMAKRAVRYDGLELPFDVARKLRLIKTSQPLVAPGDAAEQIELAGLSTELSGMYGKGRYCPGVGDCMDLGDLARLFATSRDPDELLKAWIGWRWVSPPMRERYSRFVELGNRGAVELGFDNLGDVWKGGYDMTPAEFDAELVRLFEQVRPLYEALHCHVRASLAKRYGEDVVPPDGPIPAHLLGNMWAQSWGNIYDLVEGEDWPAAGFDLTAILREKKVDAREMVRYGERFFISLGFDPLPDSFWDRSLFTKPEDRDAVCHASAWDIDFEDDLRLKMCIEINAEDFATVHHELGHNYYYWAYSKQPTLYRESANKAFHEGVGDTLSLSITPAYLANVGLLDAEPEEAGDLEFLMRMALEKVAFLPFGLLIDQWRFKVFNGEISPGIYNQAWWDLRTKYQGIAPPVPRTEENFDPGAKYHIPANTPYTRYYLAHFLQFQFHRALCETSGYEGPLHRCSIYGNAEAGSRLRNMLEMGMSRPWPEALKAVAGTDRMDATALLEYFEPLKSWLDEQNQHRTCGW